MKGEGVRVYPSYQGGEMRENVSRVTNTRTSQESCKRLEFELVLLMIIIIKKNFWPPLLIKFERQGCQSSASLSKLYHRGLRTSGVKI